MANNRYCLDANVLIQAWQKYYSPRLCPGYWEVLNELGAQNLVFIPEMVYDEIMRTEDDLMEWVSKSSIKVARIDEDVTLCLQKIYAHDPKHYNLVDNIKGRSLADPWVIAHALNEGATVVTKEDKITAINTAKVKIPNVCENMGIRWMNDFELLDELEVRFSCARD